METVYILLPVHNRKQLTEKFVSCLLNQTCQNYHLILVDDGSTDGTAQLVRRKINSLTILTGSGNWWWAGSLQRGYRWLHESDIQDDDVILIINDDVIFESEFLKTALDEIRKHPDSLLLSQERNRETGHAEQTGVFVDFKRLRFELASSPEKINCLSTRGLFIKWRVVKEVGGFYPRMLPHYLSDYEYSIRAARKGYRLLTNTAVVIESNTETTGYRELEDLPFFVFLKRYFSKRSTANPIYWTSFILLACPIHWVPINIARIWFRAIRKISGQFSRSFTRAF